jgi:hypothetical protein
MLITFKSAFADAEHVQVTVPPGHVLGTLLAPHVSAIHAVMVGDTFIEDWQHHALQDTDRLTVFLTVQDFITPSLIIAAVVATLISTALSLVLSVVLRALTPTPSRSEGKPEQVYGIAGLTNTTSQGTPKLLCYGTRRVYGHILTTRAVVVTEDEMRDGTVMKFGILYFMGEGPIESITQAQINDVAVEQSGTGVDVYTRLGGADNATLIHEDFTTLSQVWTDGRQMALGQPLVYQTRSTACAYATLILFLPTMQTESGGAATLHFHLEISTVAANSYETIFPQLQWVRKSLGGRYRQIRIILPSADQWLIKLTLTSSNNAQDVMPTLFNVMEEQTGSALYPNCALMAFVGIASNQIQSFDAMRGSGLVQGLKVDVWNGASFTNQWTNQRAWIIRHVLTDARIGLGHRIDASLFDDDAALVVQNYWDGIGYGTVTRDECNVLINDRRAEWDWIKVLLSEGRAALVPSGGKLKLIVDKDDTPGLVYAMPGNIVPDTLLHRQGSGQALIPNNILYQFVDRDNTYQTHAEAFRAPGTGGEPLREAPALTFYSLTDWSRAYWLARYTLLRQRLVQRHLEWHSPSTALVSEPLDHVSVSYDTPDFSRGASGFLGPDSTTTRLVLDQLVTLAPSTTYSVLVRHQANNTVEERTVSTGAGDWGALTLSSALSTAPAAGDIYVVGVVGSSIMHLIIEAVEQSDDLTYRLAASEYVQSVYSFPAPPSAPYAPPWAPPPAEGGNTVPSAPILSGVFGGSGTISMSWTQATPAPGDTIAYYELYLSRFDEEHFEFFAGPLSLSYEQIVAELVGGWFAVRAVATAGGAGPFSNHVHSDWQMGSSSD